MQIIPRNHSLDALRGLAILLMVLSSSISFGILPAWMYHAQVPPPHHIFNPDLPGISWVDLVFPFFLFSMGAAFPLAMQKKAENQYILKVLASTVQRYFLLVSFAIFTVHARSGMMNSTPGLKEYLLSVCCFFVLFLIYSQGGSTSSKRLGWLWKISGLILALLFLSFYPFAKGFSFYTNDIIIIVLANMALFGSLVWFFTRKNPLLRIGILPFIMAIFLASKDLGSWNSYIFNWSPATWMYTFYFLKYLFIVLPATLAGEWLLAAKPEVKVQPQKSHGLFIAILCWALLLCNLVGLYNRWLVLNLMATLLLSGLILLLLKQVKEGVDKSLFTKFIHAGIYLLMLGLFFEAYEGGIKKDISTYSYYFVTAGLGFLILLSFIIFEKLGYFSSVLTYLSNTGKNPMIAYTAGNLLLIPLLKLSGAHVWLDNIGITAAGGFMRGIIFTGIVSLITVFCTKKNLFWKT
ncbi:MAG: hypothetical protein JWR67_55 [Mucilaginibacter sp.]|nr:hypothetical protein [Mucilaginibacter sp.]